MECAGRALRRRRFGLPRRLRHDPMERSAPSQSGVAARPTRSATALHKETLGAESLRIADEESGGLVCASRGMKIYVDGKYLDEKHATVSVFDHGLLYGDGVFEGIRAYNGRVFKLREHIDRLFYSAKGILLTIPMSHADIMEAVVDTCRRNKIRDGYVRLVVTRGAGTLGL